VAARRDTTQRLRWNATAAVQRNGRATQAKAQTPPAVRSLRRSRRVRAARSIALPLIGAGGGGMNQERVKTIRVDEFSK